MKYLAGCVSDVGIQRKNNQDSISYTLAAYQGEPLAFLVMCDGMGGFSQGEVASAEVVTAFDGWFRQQLPRMLENGFSAEALREEWYALAATEHRRIANYGASQNIKLGTTLTAALFWGQQYYILHVGDCRLYEITQGEARQLTHDHTVTQREVDSGALAPEDAENDPRQHMLLQCLGAGKHLAPDFVVGTIRPNASYLVCSDGFRHKYSREEICGQFQASRNGSRKKIEKNITDAITVVKNRGETDNITAGLLVVT